MLFQRIDFEKYNRSARLVYWVIVSVMVSFGFYRLALENEKRVPELIGEPLVIRTQQGYNAQVDSVFSLLESIISNDKRLSDNESLTRINLQLEKMSRDLKKTSDQTLALRQAVNPDNPLEIITIARQGDKIKALEKRMGEVEVRQAAEMERFRQAVIRELEASDRTRTTILVLMVPLVLNFGYQLWRDRQMATQADEDKTVTVSKGGSL